MMILKMHMLYEILLVINIVIFILKITIVTANTLFPCIVYIFFS